MPHAWYVDKTHKHTLALCCTIYWEFKLTRKRTHQTLLFQCNFCVYTASDVMHLYISAPRIAIFCSEILFTFLFHKHCSVTSFIIIFLVYADSNKYSRYTYIFWIRIYIISMMMLYIKTVSKLYAIHDHRYKLYFLRSTSTFYLCMLSIYISHSHSAICYLFSICTL